MNHIEIVPIRYRPIELTVEVRDAKRDFDLPNRYMIEVQVLEPQAKKDTILHLLVEDVTEERRGFTALGSLWRISCDEEAFEHEQWIEFSWWTFAELSPEKKPNQSAEPTSPSGHASP